MSSPIVESFSITHASILTGIAPTGELNLYGVRSASLDLDTDSYQNTGDDGIQSVWNWFNFATLTVESGYISFDVLNTLTGAATTSSGTAPNDFWNLPIWNKGSLNLPSLPVLLRTAGKKHTGTVGVLDFILYKVQFDPIKFDGVAYKNGMSASYTGKCLISKYDEYGNTLADPAIGRMRYGPRAIVVLSTQVVDNGNGTYTISGTGVTNNADGSYTIQSGNIINNGDGTFTVSY